LLDLLYKILLKESHFVKIPKFRKRASLPGVKQLNRRDIQEQIRGFTSVDSSFLER